MLKPVPGMTDEDAVRDIEAGIDYLSEQALAHGVDMNMHLNPTFVAHGTPLEKSFRAGEYSPPRLRDAARAALHARGKNLSIYVGINDEGMAVEGGSFRRPGDEALIGALEDFNRTQDFEALERFCDRYTD